MDTLFPNQVKAGREIAYCWQQGISNYVILAAQMQSGKTGTAKAAIIEMKFKPHECVFICGMNDNDLRNQAVREFQGLILEENILFSKQLQRLNAIETPQQLEALIIDESHYASERGSQIDLFLKKTRATYTLSISATPMAEIATSQKLGKFIVRLEPGPNYYGLRDIFREGLIFQAQKLTGDAQEPGDQFFLDQLALQYEHERNQGKFSYWLIKLPSQWHRQDMEEMVLESGLEIDFINHNCSEAQVVDFNNYVSTPPKKRPTIIWIYNSLRAGKQLDTRNIGLVYDSSKSRPDTISQALLGRILGYNKESHRVKCFTDMQSAELMLHWVRNLYDPGFIPAGSRHIIGGLSSADAKRKWVKHPPIYFTLPDSCVREYRELKLRCKNRYPYKRDFIEDVLDGAECNGAECNGAGCNGTEGELLLNEILRRYKPGKHGGLMILTENNSSRSFKEHWTANYQAYLKQRPVRGFEADFLEPCYYLFFNLNPNSPQYGAGLLIYKEPINETESKQMIKEHVALTAKSRFN